MVISMRKFNIYKKKGEMPMKIGVFLSGSGTNFEAIINYIKTYNIDNAEISFVFTNVPDCAGAVKAVDNGIKVISLSSKRFFNNIGKSPEDDDSRILYDRDVLKLLSEFKDTDIILLAGYRRRLSSLFYEIFRNRIINMYPGDITKKYLVKGVPASLQALRNNDSQIKCTVYVDRENVRFGTAILQSKPIDLESFSEDKIDKLDKFIREKAEWAALPHVIFEFIGRERLSADDNGRLYLDDNIIPENGIQL